MLMNYSLLMYNSTPVVALTAAEVTEGFPLFTVTFPFSFLPCVTLRAFMIVIRKSFIAIDQINVIIVEVRTAMGALAEIR